jgi:predicted MFS family arabinose efflux permease
MALAIVACSAPLAGAIIVPILSKFIEANGWRAGYLGIAGLTAIGGGVAVLMASEVRDERPAVPQLKSQRSHGYGELLRNPTFYIVMIGLFLCNISFVMQSTQLKVIILGLGIPEMGATLLLSMYALGVFAGRILCGIALDTLPAYLVAGVAMSFPGLGLFILALEPSSVVWAALACVFLGMSLGAEGDVAAYLTVKYFGIEVYSTVVGFAMGAIALSGAVGSLLLSITFDAIGSFTPFIAFCSVAAFCGSGCFWLLKRRPSWVMLAGCPDNPEEGPAAGTARLL